MEDFFKQFRDNLERRPAPSFELRDWQDLEKRLEKQKAERKAIPIWWWFAWPLLLLSLSANALLYSGLKTSGRQIVYEIKRDTVFQTRVVFTRDTIYKTRIERIPSSVNYAFSKKPLSPATNAPADTGTSNHLPVSLSAGNQSPANSILPTHVFPALPQRPPLFTYGLMPLLKLPEIPIEPVAQKQKRTLYHHLYSMRPKGFRLGVAGGWAYPHSTNPAHRGGYSAGLEAAVEFSPKLRLWISAMYTNTSYLSDRMDEGIGIPVVTPPSNDFTFVEAEASQPALEYTAGMQYLFNSSRRFKPFVGIGLGAVSLRPYEIVYDFENQPLGIEWSLDKEIGRHTFLTSLLLLRAGFEYDVSQHWSGFFRATWRSQMTKTDIRIPDMSGIQAGFMRRF